MNQSDEKYYAARERENEKRLRALSKANYRGEKSVEWHQHNKLTPQTLDAFKKAMKQADKEWELLQKI